MTDISGHKSKHQCFMYLCMYVHFMRVLATGKQPSRFDIIIVTANFYSPLALGQMPQEKRMDVNRSVNTLSKYRLACCHQ